MFDKELFFALCEKYNVELSDSAEKPMMKDKYGVHEITMQDVRQIFSLNKTFFEYTGDKIDTNMISKSYYLQEDFAVAC